MSLGMIANRANLRRFGTHNQVTAVTALPHHNAGFLKNSLGLHVVQQSQITLLMGLLNGSNTAELTSQVMEAFLISLLGEHSPI